MTYLSEFWVLRVKKTARYKGEQKPEQVAAYQHTLEQYDEYQAVLLMKQDWIPFITALMPNNC
ncbi:hypothetical protein L5B97_08595 [Avibacterium sp. 20-15]|uniref:hypothetical protein n=1 Tax=unclassified Avibacterium TaxID=2685287 RepID=UPI0020272ED9|nr:MULTISPECIES: hypothetical protein [unclassified Avibacterium]URL01497.1 hypothetical protein L4F91_08120 [Avibacterium sp. 20-126]MCW9732026.1 hypothetical protein [Avibacterium sp. 20-15]MCW9733519.1 hypothetical protein [Avibacterium sp. 20-15]URL03379.1 hypothetical protein L4F93_07285 [Avibacterium sp. 20-132]URL04207.1 hypothetical protein L4F93_11810 [Avibacterium sp. 20-132]